MSDLDFPYGSTALHLLHADPFVSYAGGTQRHALDIVREFAFARSLIIYPSGSDIGIAEVSNGDTSVLRVWSLPRPARDRDVERRLESLIDEYQIALAHIHHLLGWPLSVWTAFQRKRVPFFYTVHDFYCVCPNYNLYDYTTGQPCTCDLRAETTRNCLHAFVGMRTHAADQGDSTAVQGHRQTFSQLFSAAAAVIFPSRFAHDKVVSYHSLPADKAYIVPHGLPNRQFSAGTISDAALYDSRSLRVGIVGYVHGKEKGADNYLALARLSQLSRILWYVFGDVPSEFQEEFRFSATGQAYFSGRYQRHSLGWLLFQYGIDVVVMVPTVPETFSYTLSEALYAGIPVIGTTSGAIGERLTELGLGDFIAADIHEVARKLMSLSSSENELRDAKRRAERVRVPDLAASAVRLAEIYRAHAEPTLNTLRSSAR